MLKTSWKIEPKIFEPIEATAIYFDRDWAVRDYYAFQVQYINYLTLTNKFDLRGWENHTLLEYV